MYKIPETFYTFTEIYVIGWESYTQYHFIESMYRVYAGIFFSSVNLVLASQEQ